MYNTYNTESDEESQDSSKETTQLGNKQGITGRVVQGILSNLNITVIIIIIGSAIVGFVIHKSILKIKRR